MANILRIRVFYFIIFILLVVLYFSINLNLPTVKFTIKLIFLLIIIPIRYVPFPLLLFLIILLLIFFRRVNIFFTLLIKLLFVLFMSQDISCAYAIPPARLNVPVIAVRTLPLLQLRLRSNWPLANPINQSTIRTLYNVL